MRIKHKSILVTILILNSKVKNEAISVKIGELEKEAKTDDEGYFRFEIFNKKEAWKNHQKVGKPHS